MDVLHGLEKTVLMPAVDAAETAVAPWWPFLKWGALALAILIPLGGWYRTNSLLALQIAATKTAEVNVEKARSERAIAISQNSGLARQLSMQAGQLNALAASCEARSKEPAKVGKEIIARPVKISADEGPIAMTQWLKEEFSGH